MFNVKLTYLIAGVVTGFVVSAIIRRKKKDDECENCTARQDAEYYDDFFRDFFDDEPSEPHSVCDEEIEVSDDDDSDGFFDAEDESGFGV